MTGEIKQIVQNLAVSHVDILNSLTKESIKAIDEIKRLGEENEDLKGKLAELHKRNEDQFLRARKHIQELLKRQTVADPFIVSTYRPIDEEDSESREITVFGEENARRVFKRKVSSEAYWCVRLDRAKYNEHNGTIDYIGKQGKLEYWVKENVPWLVREYDDSDIPWWIEETW